MMKRSGSPGAALGFVMALTILVGPGPALAADAPVGKWKTVDEKSGRMLTMKNPCIILEDIVCEGAFSANCPREFVCWWREIWLERVEPGS